MSRVRIRAGLQLLSGTDISDTLPKKIIKANRLKNLLEKRMIGQTISHYKILDKLGGGGMGVVYKAEDTRLGRTVALKFLPPLLSLDEDAKKRFINEARTVSSLQHHNICTIHDIDETGEGQIFICMDLYEGETLKEKITKGQIETSEAIDIIIQAAAGLRKAHEKGIIHRDIKPANIFITNDGVVKILDFGLAKLAGQTILTKMGETLGTVAYMSPEQARGEEVDQRTDIWSLGVVLYELLTGQRPFKSDYDQAMVYLILNEDPVSPSSLQNELPEDLVKIILKTLNKNPDDRYQSTDEFISELEYFRDSTVPHKTIKSTHRFTAPKSGLLWLVSSVVIILISVIVVSQIFLKDEVKPISSIAVLPLKNLTGDPGQEFFSDGMTEALILELGQSGSFKRVISLTSVMTYKDKNRSLPQIAAELGVEAVVEGSFSRYGDRVYITAQLINGKDDRVLWTKKFESGLPNILQLQSNIARSIVAEIKMKISPEDSIRFANRRTVNTDAYQYYLQGNYQLTKMSDAAVLKAIALFEKAIAFDSTYAPAYVGLADAFSKRSWGYAPMSVNLANQKAEDYALKAVELDVNNAQAYSVLGQVYMNQWKWHDAGVELKKAVKLNPNSAAARQNYSLYLMVLGRFEQSISEIKAARQLDPLSMFIRTQVGWPYWFSGQYEQSLKIFKEVVDLEPNFALANYNVGEAYIMMNNPEAAVTAYKKAVDLAPGNIIFESLLWYARAIAGDTAGANKYKEQIIERWENSHDFSPYLIAIVSAGLNETDEVFKWLERVVEWHDAFGIVMSIEPIFKKYRSDPRFKRLVQKMGFED